MSEFDDFYRHLQTVTSGTLAIVAAFPEIGEVGSLPEIGQAIESTMGSLRRSGRVTVVRSLWSRAALLAPSDGLQNVIAELARAQSMFGTGLVMRAVVARCSDQVSASALFEQMDEEVASPKNFGMFVTVAAVRIIDGQIVST